MFLLSWFFLQYLIGFLMCFFLFVSVVIPLSIFFSLSNTFLGFFFFLCLFSCDLFSLGYFLIIIIMIGFMSSPHQL